MSFTKIKNLYIAVNHVVAELGKDGEIQRRNELVENLMMALHSIDHGEFKPDLFDRAQAKLEAQAAKIAELEKDAERYRWLRNRPDHQEIYIGVDSHKYPSRWSLLGEYADYVIDVEMKALIVSNI